MKRKELERRLRQLGFELIEGGNHTKILKNGKFLSVLGRHSEIGEKRVKEIEKQLDVTIK